MHPEASQWVADNAPHEHDSVLDIGGRNINGTARDHFPRASVYRSVDIQPGPAVDIVANAAEWTPDQEYDVVVCTEVFEHTDQWRQICETAFDALKPGGKFITTMAGPGRTPHSAVDGGPTLHPGEYYGNVDPDDLRDCLDEIGFQHYLVDQSGLDVRAVAYKE